MIQYYSAEKLNTHMTAIRSLTGEIMYLIEGEEKAVLVDTCLGVGHLRKFVETLTEKPITVILTHGHVDHALGAPEFDEVYMNPCRSLRTSGTYQRNDGHSGSGGKDPDPRRCLQQCDLFI